MTTPPVAVIKRKKIIRAFLHAHATSPASSKLLAQLGLHDSLVLRRLWRARSS